MIASRYISSFPARVEALESLEGPVQPEACDPNVVAATLASENVVELALRVASELPRDLFPFVFPGQDFVEDHG